MDQEQNMTPKDESFPSATSSEKSNLSMFVGVGAFLIILVGLIWYVYQGGLSQGNETAQLPLTPKSDTAVSTTTEDAAAAALSTQGSSDAVIDINADLKATNLDSLGDIDKI